MSDMAERPGDDGSPTARAQRDHLANVLQDAAETLERNRVVRARAARLLAWRRQPRRQPAQAWVFDPAADEPASPERSSAPVD